MCSLGEASLSSEPSTLLLLLPLSWAQSVSPVRLQKPVLEESAKLGGLFIYLDKLRSAWAPPGGCVLRDCGPSKTGPDFAGTEAEASGFQIVQAQNPAVGA